MLKEEIFIYLESHNKQNNYLIEKVDNNNYFIHRELNKNEVNKYEESDIFDYKGKKYLYCVTNAPSKKIAELLVFTTWKASESSRQKVS